MPVSDAYAIAQVSSLVNSDTEQPAAGIAFHLSSVHCYPVK
jgi:hypothetical protein